MTARSGALRLGLRAPGALAVFWPKEEIATDPFHYAVHAAATGIAY
jgi:hypothetical protein